MIMCSSSVTAASKQKWRGSAAPTDLPPQLQSAVTLLMHLLLCFLLLECIIVHPCRASPASDALRQVLERQPCVAARSNSSTDRSVASAVDASVSSGGSGSGGFHSSLLSSNTTPHYFTIHLFQPKVGGEGKIDWSAGSYPSVGISLEATGKDQAAILRAICSWARSEEGTRMVVNPNQLRYYAHASLDNLHHVYMGRIY